MAERRRMKPQTGKRQMRRPGLLLARWAPLLGLIGGWSLPSPRWLWGERVRARGQDWIWSRRESRKRRGGIRGWAGGGKAASMSEKPDWCFSFSAIA